MVVVAALGVNGCTGDDATVACDLVSDRTIEGVVGKAAVLKLSCDI